MILWLVSASSFSALSIGGKLPSLIRDEQWWPTSQSGRTLPLVKLGKCIWTEAGLLRNTQLLQEPSDRPRHVDVRHGNLLAANERTRGKELVFYCQHVRFHFSESAWSK